MELNQINETTEQMAREQVIQPAIQPTTASVPSANSGGSGFITNIIMSLVISAMVMTGALYVYDQNYAQKVVTYDMVKSIDALKVLYVQGKIDDKQLSQAVQDIKTKIDKSTAKNDIVIVKDVIVSGNIKEISQ